MRDLVIATGNAGKLAEIKHELAGLPFTILGLKDVFTEAIDIEEPGETLEGNAIIKAMTIGKRTGKLTIADDTGIEVDALDGEPGVRSARYIEGTDEDRYRFLLQKMEGISEERRGAQFRAVIAIYDPERGDTVRLAQGVARGKIAREPVPGGHGYDPIFVLDATGAMQSQLSVEERSITHRGKAMIQVRELLLKEFV